MEIGGAWRALSQLPSAFSGVFGQAAVHVHQRPLVVPPWREPGRLLSPLPSPEVQLPLVDEVKLLRSHIAGALGWHPALQAHAPGAPPQAPLAEPAGETVTLDVLDRDVAAGIWFFSGVLDALVGADCTKDLYDVLSAEVPFACHDVSAAVSNVPDGEVTFFVGRRLNFVHVQVLGNHVLSLLLYISAAR